MYPGLFVWWNPVFHFPLSGAVNQELVQEMRNQLRKVQGMSLEIKKLSESEKNQNLKLKEHLDALCTQLDQLDHTIMKW